MGAEKLSPTGIRSPGLPARSESHTSRSLFYVLSWFLLHVDLQLFSILCKLLWDILFTFATNPFCIPVFCPKLGLYLVLL